MCLLLQIGMLIDKNGAFARLLGVDIELPETKGPYQQRYLSHFSSFFLTSADILHQDFH